MSDLKYRKEKIKIKRSDTDFFDFLRDIWSWTTLIFNKKDWYISRYPDSDRVTICHYRDFEQNRDSYTDYWIDYDYLENFFDNFSKLFRSVPLPNVFHVWENENCEYVDISVYAKNSYLSFMVTLESENVYHSFMVRENCKDIFSSFYIIKNCSNIYFSGSIINSYKIFYSMYINNSNNVWFSSNLIWCSECIFCDDLQNSKYYINNKKYSKEDYFIKKEIVLKDKTKFLDYYKNLNKKWINYNSSNCKWNFIIDSENVENWFWVLNMVNSRNLMFSWSEYTWENCFDLIFAWKWTNDCYWVSNFWWEPDNIFLSYNVWYSSNIFYSYWLVWCSYCLWCVWLQNKQYCILNKQYTKENRLSEVDNIFLQMEKDQILWDYFPWYINPLNFNDTFAYLFWKFDKKEVLSMWYMWRDDKLKNSISSDLSSINIFDIKEYQWYNSEWKWEIKKDIINKVIISEKWDYYSIVKEEYNFLQKHWLAIPEAHWYDRMRINLWM